MTGRVLGGCRCDPAVATIIATVGSVTLYRTKSRRFFTEDAHCELRLLTDDEAAAWIGENCDEDTLEQAFDTSPLVHLTVDLPAWLVRRMDRQRGRKSRRAVIQAAIETFYKN